jgi:malic enzyme
MATVKQALQRLTEENMDMAINKHVKFLIENVEENQLLFKLSTTVGVKIDNNMIHLWYNPGIGFQCKNMWEDRYGKLPICGRVERFLNQEITKP